MNLGFATVHSLHALAGLIVPPTPPFLSSVGRLLTTNRACSHHHLVLKVDQENGQERPLSTAKSYTDLAFEGLVKSSLNIANETHLRLLFRERFLFTCSCICGPLSLTFSLSIRFHSG